MDIPKEFEDEFIQSPIGLVPKDDGKKTRLIFHLSYPRGRGLSVNECTPEHLKTVQYPDLDEAVLMCLHEGIGCYLAKSDLTAAFRQLGLARKWWRYLFMKAKHPVTGRYYFFLDKCVPFGAAVSCQLFQHFSNALAFVIKKITGQPNLNYLDDFFFLHLLRTNCDYILSKFVHLCKMINLPISPEKTSKAGTRMVFLGLLLDTVKQMIFIPIEKIEKALNMIDYVLNKKSKKIKLKQLQQLCGYLNFLSKAVVPGRTFTRRIYSFGSALTKPDHHLYVKQELKQDLRAWRVFLTSQEAFGRPFFHFDAHEASDVPFFTDASRAVDLGCGGVCGQNYFIQQWDHDLIEKYEPSIAFLELYACEQHVFQLQSMYEVAQDSRTPLYGSQHTTHR